MSRLGRGLTLAWALTLASVAAAHELGPIQVQVEFHEDGTHVVQVRVDDEHLPPLLDRVGSEPSGAVIEGLPASLPERTRSFLVAYVARARARFDGRDVAAERVAFVPAVGTEVPSLATRRVEVRWVGRTPPGARSFTWREGVELPYHPVSVTVAGEPRPTQQWVRGGEATEPVPLHESVVPGLGAVIVLYAALGFSHILPQGLDHILFVLGLVLLSRRLQPVLIQVSAFTAAHTLTLALSTQGIVELPSRVVEPLIAASIVYVAVENLLTSELRPSRAAVVFGFGLLHGMGFAGVLREIGIPQDSFLASLLAFNLGVEAGQLTVILTAFGLAWLLAPSGAAYRRRVVVPASLTIAATGLYWAMERVLF
jgi:hypothetical protein